MLVELRISIVEVVFVLGEAVMVEKFVVSALAKDSSIAQRGRREECKAILKWKVAIVNPHGRIQ